MVDKKITDFDAISTEADGDLFEIVGDVATTPASYKITRKTLLNYPVTFGQIYVYSGSTAQTGIATSYVKLTAFTTDGESNNVTPSGDTIAVTNIGVYRVAWQVSYGGSGNTTFTIAPHFDGTEVQACAVERKTGTGGDVVSCGTVGYYNVTAAGTFDLRIKADGASKSVTPSYAQLTVERVKLG